MSNKTCSRSALLMGSILMGSIFSSTVAGDVLSYFFGGKSADTASIRNIDINNANTGRFDLEIKSMSFRSLGTGSYNTSNSASLPQDMLFSTELKRNSGEDPSFRVSFQYNILMGGKEVESAHLFTIDGNNIESPRKIQNDKKAKQGTKLCNILDANSLGEYKCFIIDYPAKSEQLSIYKKVAVKTYDKDNNLLMQFSGEMSKLDVSLKSSASDGIYDTLVIKNFYSEEVLIDITGGKYLFLGKGEEEIKDVKIAGGKAYEVILKLKPNSDISKDDKRMEDTFGIVYTVGDKTFSGKVNIILDDAKFRMQEVRNNALKEADEIYKRKLEDELTVERNNASVKLGEAVQKIEKEKSDAIKAASDEKAKALAELERTLNSKREKSIEEENEKVRKATQENEENKYKVKLQEIENGYQRQLKEAEEKSKKDKDEAVKQAETNIKVKSEELQQKIDKERNETAIQINKEWNVAVEQLCKNQKIKSCFSADKKGEQFNKEVLLNNVFRAGRTAGLTSRENLKSNEAQEY